MFFENLLKNSANRVLNGDSTHLLLDAREVRICQLAQAF